LWYKVDLASAVIACGGTGLKMQRMVFYERDAGASAVPVPA